jgi:hypothetical protein
VSFKIRPRSRGGRDVPENLLALCVAHHTGNDGWHTLGGRRWFGLNGHLLTPSSVAKILAVYGARWERS